LSAKFIPKINTKETIKNQKIELSRIFIFKPKKQKLRKPSFPPQFDHFRVHHTIADGSKLNNITTVSTQL